MWRNREVVRFLRWLRGENAGRAMDDRVGFYGLDLYSLYASIHAVTRYLDQVDPDPGGHALLEADDELLPLPESPADPVTFSRDIAPILFEHCVACHRPGGAA